MGKIRDPMATIQYLSRRRFLRSSAGLALASWAGGTLGPELVEGATVAPAVPPLATDLTDHSKPGRKTWTPVSQALARFSGHRFECEREFQAVSNSLEALRSALLAGGAGIEACFSPRFRSVSLAPGAGTNLRDDSGFVVRRAVWDGSTQSTPLLGRGEFAGEAQHDSTNAAVAD